MTNCCCRRARPRLPEGTLRDRAHATARLGGRGEEGGGQGRRHPPLHALRACLPRPLHAGPAARTHAHARAQPPSLPPPIHRLPQSHRHGPGSRKHPLNVTPTFTHSRTHTPTHTSCTDTDAHTVTSATKAAGTQALGEPALLSPALGKEADPVKRPSRTGGAGVQGGGEGRGAGGQGRGRQCNTVLVRAAARWGTGRCPWWGDHPCHAECGGDGTRNPQAPAVREGM